MINSPSTECTVARNTPKFVLYVPAWQAVVPISPGERPGGNSCIGPLRVHFSAWLVVHCMREFTETSFRLLICGDDSMVHAEATILTIKAPTSLWPPAAFCCRWGTHGEIAVDIVRR